MTNKKQLRQRLLAQRQVMSTVTWQQKSDAICRYLLVSEQICSARTILAYASFRQEPDLRMLLRSRFTHAAPFSSAPILGLPRCQGQSLIWHQWHPMDSPPLKSGAYGIPEPDSSLPMVDPSTLGAKDVILVPAVGCDRQGYRLGYGGGFYDRLLSTSPWNIMTTIGIVFDFAYLDCLPYDPWDQPLFSVCTESGFVFTHPNHC